MVFKTVHTMLPKGTLVQRIDSTMEKRMNKFRVCVAGATGWAGSALAQGIFSTDDMDLVAAISRSHSGKSLGEIIGIEDLTAPIFGTAEDALKARPDVFVEYT